MGFRYIDLSITALSLTLYESAKIMINCNTLLRLILLLTLFISPYLLGATGGPKGNPLNGGPENPDSIAAQFGHCERIIWADTSCSTQTITLSAYLLNTITHIFQPVIGEWSTGDTAHKITVVPPGTWSFEVSGVNCPPPFIWDTEYTTNSSFFIGPLVITGPSVVCIGQSYELDVFNPGGIPLPFVDWAPPIIANSLPLTVDAPGTYSLYVEDDFGCPLSDQIVVQASIPAPYLLPPYQLCPEGDTGFVQVAPMYSQYLWDTGDTLNPLMITQPGTYSVTITDQYGCTAIKETIVPSAGVPDITIDMSAPAICPGQSEILTASPGYILYEWSNEDLGITNIVTQPGTYTVTVTNQYGCTGMGSATVDALPSPTITITNTPFCPGGTSTLTVTGGGFDYYLWSEGQTTSSINTSTPGAYSVTVSSASFCATSTSITLSPSLPPTTIIAPPAQLSCTAPLAVLDAMASTSGPGFTFVWTTVGGSFVTGQNTLTPKVNGAGIYTLQVINVATGCSSTASVTVTSNMQAPPAPVGNPAMLNCTVTNLIIGPDSLPTDTTLLPSWSVAGGGNIVSGQDTWNPNVDQPGTYILTVKNLVTGCSANGSVVIGLDTSPPMVTAAPPAQITCTMGAVPLDGSASSSGPNFTYLWATANGSITGSPSAAMSAAGAVGTYMLLVTNTLNNCTATAAVTVTAEQNVPNLGVLPPATLNCSVLQIPLDATQSSSGPTINAIWTGPSPGSIVSGQGTLMPIVNAPGIYTLLLVDSTNSCSASFNVNVQQDILPPTANAGQNATLNCLAPTLKLDGSASSTGPQFTCQWTTTNGNITGGSTTLTPIVSMAGTYVLQVTDQANGCTSTSSVQVVTDTTLPQAAIAQPALLTCATLQTVVNAMASSQAPSFIYTWSGPGITGGQGTLQPTVNLPGVYTLDIVNTTNGCTDTETVTVQQDIAAPTALAGPDGQINCMANSGSIGSAGNPSGSNIVLQWTTVGGIFTSPTNGPTATVSAAGMYTLMVTNLANGCTGTDDVVVLADFAQPVVDAGPSFELSCGQPTAMLEGMGSTGANFAHLWITGNGFIVGGATTLNPTVNENGTYTLLTTNLQNGCTATDSVVITINALAPTAIIAQPNTLNCLLTSFDLNANGSSVAPTISYTWTAENGGNIMLGGNTLTPSVDAPGTYTLQVFDSAIGCSSTETVTVTQNIEKPVVDADAIANLLTCTILNLPLQTTIVSSSTPNLAYAWATATGTILSGANTPSPTVGAPGIYIVTVTDAANGCTGTDQLPIFENVTLPTAIIASPLALTCAVQQVTLSAMASSLGPNFVYEWTSPTGNFVSLQNPQQPIVDEQGTYKLLITDINNGCSQSASVTVPEDMVPPAADAGSTVGLDCDTPISTLNGTGSSAGANFSYLWTTNNGLLVSGATTLAPQVGAPGAYTLTVSNSQNGCTSTDSVVVTEDLTTPAFVITPPQVLTCLITTTPVTGSGSGFGSLPTYTWATSDGNIVYGGNTLSATVDAPGTYTLTILNNQTGCASIQQVHVAEEVILPPVSVQPVGPLTCTVLQQSLQGNAPTAAVLQWTTQDGNIVLGASTPNPTVDQPGLYTLTATLPTGCSNTAQVAVLQEMDIPTSLVFSLDPPLCNGTLGTLAILQVNGGIGPYEYSIDGGAVFFPAQEIGDLQPGTYNLMVQDANGCQFMEIVPVPEPPTPAVSLPPSFEIILGDNQQLQAAIPPSFPLAMINHVIWDPLTGLSFTGSSIEELLNPVAMPLVTTEYNVAIVTAEGCRAESRTVIGVNHDLDIYAPNIIMPEDPDGLNGAFTLFTRPGTLFQVLSLHIYDRWGEEMFVNKNFSPDKPELGWAGTFKGEPVNPGVFIWWAEVELIDGQKRLLKGDVTVVR